MRWLIFSGLAATLACAQSNSVAVSNITADGVGHSSLRLVWDNSVPINAIRVRYGYTTAYEAGPGGGIFVPGTSLFSRLGQTVALSGLAPGTNYHFCPQASGNGGQSWSECVDFPITLPALPAIHPELPVAPVPVDTHYPQQTGATFRVSPNCSDLQTIMDQAHGGDTILIPPQTTCSGTYSLPPAVEAVRFTPDQVNTLTNQITLPAHGFADGQKVHLDTEGCLPGSIGPDVFCQLRGVLPGSDYFVKRVDANTIQLRDAARADVSFAVASFAVNASTFALEIAGELKLYDRAAVEVRSTGTLPGGLEPRKTYYVVAGSERELRLALTPGGPPIQVTSTGSGTHFFADPGAGTHAVMAWPPPETWIVVRTATPDDQFCPEGVRCLGKIWGSKMARIAQTSRPAGNLSDVRLYTGMLSHHWRFVGIEFTHADNSSAALTSTDPTPYYGFISTRRTASHIVFDRCYIHGLGFPNRVYRAIVAFDGEFMALTNSDLENLDFWHPAISSAQDFQPTVVNPQTVLLNPGTIHLGTGKFAVSPATLTVAGTASGNGLIYLTTDGSMKVVLPVGLTGTCSGPSRCTVETASSSIAAYPLDANGRIAVAQITELAVANGQVTSAIHAAGYQRSVTSSEGAQSLIAGNGPGPVLLENNLISGTGIPIHFDDSGGDWYERHDYIVRRNLFTAPLSQGDGPESDGYRYFHRNMLEWKGGQRILVEGNVFEHNYSEVAPLGAPLVITPRAGGYVTDVLIRDNTFRSNAGGLMLAAVDSYNPVSRPMQRVSVVNNLFHHNSGYAYTVPRNRGSTGILVYFGYAAADFRFDHNTVYDTSGFNPSIFHFVLNPVEGISITNNILWMNDDANRQGIDGESVLPCSGTAKILMDCLFTAGDRQRAYTFDRNLLIPGWRSSSTRTQLLDPQLLRSAYDGLPNVWVATGTTLGDRLAHAGIALLGEQGGDFRINAQSPYAAGGASAASDGSAIGANIDLLEQAQGLLTAPSITDVERSSATIRFLAPDPGAACYLLHGTGTDMASFSRTQADTAAKRERTFSLSGLREGTRYTVMAVCSGASNFALGEFSTVPARR